MKRVLAIMLTLLMVLSLIPVSALAANDYTINSTTSTDDYYNLITKSDWDIAPGITESQIVLNNDEGSRRQVLFVMEADLNNEYVKVINSYTGMVPEYGSYKTGVMSEQAAYAEANGYGNVVGAMNTTLSWYSGYPADRVGEPLGFIMLDAETLFDPGNCGYDYGNVGFPSVLVINKDFDENGNPRPDDIPKVEMPQIRTSADLDGWEDQVIPVSSGYIVKDGKNVNSPDHSSAAPRSVVGIKPDGTVVIMLNDGRQSPYSAGMSMYELAEVMLDLGCSYAVNCDGGGSSTWLSQRPGEELKVNNSPSDGAERPTTSGILFISTAPATGEFVRAQISTEDQFYTPGSAVQFSAVGADMVGTAAEIPAEAYWQLADSSFGTIDGNGLFVSNGKTGDVTAQMVYNGKVVGEASIHVVVPESISFSMNNVTVPYGKTLDLEVVATYGVNTVVLKDGDITLSLSDEKLGTLNGLTFTASEDTSITGGTVTAVFAGTELACETNLILGKGSVVVEGFEDGDISHLVLNHKAEKYNVSDEIYIVDSQSGQVHSGEKALAYEFDYRNMLAAFNSGYYMQNMKFANIPIDGETTGFGLWMYVPELEELADVCNFCVYVTGDTSGGKVGASPSVLGNVATNEGWQYFYVDTTSLGETTSLTLALNFGLQGGQDHFAHGKYTIYIDDITIDYSTAVEDREAPVFENIGVSYAGSDGYVSMNGADIAANTVAFATNVKDATTKTDFYGKNEKETNETGLNIASAKAYIDGVQLTSGFSCTADGRMTIADVTLPDGPHTVRFEISDNMGNMSYVEDYVILEGGVSGNTVSVVPADPSADKLPIGSLYWLNIEAEAVENVQSVTTLVNLNSMNKWELDNMEVAEGFSASWTLDSVTNNATITVTRTSESNLSGEAVLASLPIRTWESDLVKDGTYTAEYMWSNQYLLPTNLSASTTLGKVTYTDGTVGSFSLEPIVVLTEVYSTGKGMSDYSSKTSWHQHTAEAMDDVDATCTASGYEGRTFCSGCNSVVDWGTTLQATGHTYEIGEDGILDCVCGELFNGEHTDGKTYIDGVVVADGWFEDTYYFIDGVKVTGQYAIDGTMYTFDENGVYLPNYSYTGFYHDGTGWTYYMGNFQKKGFVVIDGNTHFFDDYTGYAPIGSFTLGNGRVYKVEGEQGKVLGAWDTVTVDGVERRRYYYSLRYYKNQWLEVEGETYYFNNEGYALIGKRAVARSGEYLGGYEFDMDGKLIGAISGPFTDNESGLMYVAEDGVLACNKLVKYNGDYYFARSNHLLLTWGSYLSEAQTGGLLPAGEYQFGADGKLIMQNGPVADAYNPAYLTFYKDGIRVYEEGLYEYDGAYYYVRSNGLLLTWGSYISKTNNLLPAGEYQFGADGKLIMQNGPVADAYNPAYLNFYKDGIRIYEEGLYEYEGAYYYVRSNGLLLTWGSYISKTNNLLPAGEYQFGADGKLIMQSGPVADAYNPAYLNFYKDGIRIYEEGLYEYEGAYYYVRSNGLLLTWGSYISKTNNLLPAGEYQFGADGKLIMQNGPVADAFNPAYLTFYKDGVRIYKEGLYEYQGDYYYVRANGLLLTWGTYISEEKANGLVDPGDYEFGADGKMIVE